VKRELLRPSRKRNLAPRLRQNNPTRLGKNSAFWGVDVGFGL
jgi:hypothetical protein